MRVRLLAFGLFGLIWAGVAAAAPVDDAGCIVSRLSDADITTIVDESITGASDRTMEVLLPQLQACSQGQGGWAPRRGADAAAYTIGVVVKDRLGHRLADHGVDVAALDRWYRSQSVEFRTTIFAGMTDAERESAFAAMVGREVSAGQMERDGANIGGYVSALMVMERIERGLGME